MIHELDARNASRVEMIPLRHATADKLAAAINQLQSSDRGEGKVSNVSVVADAQSNSILVSGNTTSRSSVIKLIHQLDKADGAAVGQGAEVLHLNYLVAKNIAPTLTKMVGGGSKDTKTSSGSDITIEAENSSNS